MIKHTCVLVFSFIFCHSSTTLSAALDFNPNVDSAVLGIDPSQWLVDVEHLATYNRYFKSPDIQNAKNWLIDRFSELGFAVKTEEFTIRGVKGYNVVAELVGTERPNDIYILGAHYDSTSERPMIAAPGAEDNASGTAGLLAVARVVATRAPKATVRIVAFSGEEAGLYGSINHVNNIIGKGDKEKIKAALIMDMIGFSADADLDCVIETTRENQPLIDLYRSAGQKYTRLRVEDTFDYWGSDHVPFLDNHIRSALLSQGDFEKYNDYHRTTDLPRNLNIDMGGDILRLNMALLAYWIY